MASVVCHLIRTSDSGGEESNNIEDTNIDDNDSDSDSDSDPDADDSLDRTIPMSDDDDDDDGNHGSPSDCCIL